MVSLGLTMLSSGCFQSQPHEVLCVDRDGSSPTSHVDKYSATKVTSGVSLPLGF